MAEATILDFVEDYQDLDVSYDSMHYKELDTFSTGEKAILLADSILTKYKGDLEELIEDKEFTLVEEQKYFYNPQVLSFDLYGSTQYWYLLLELNNIYSAIDFNQNPIKVYDGTLPELVDAVLALEEESISINENEINGTTTEDIDEMSDDSDDVEESEDDSEDEDEDEDEDE